MMDLEALEQTSSHASDAAQATWPRGDGAAPLIPGGPWIEFGAYLRELSADAASAFGPRSGITITCTAAEALLPTTTAIRLGLIAEELIKNALEHAFPDGRTGRVAVAFAAEPGTWHLAVEDSGVGLRSQAGDRQGGLLLVRDLTGEIGGRLEIAGVIGGTRCIVVGPQPRATACNTLRGDEVGRYLELTQPLEPAHRSGEEANAGARRSDAVRRRLAASIALGWLTVEEALDETPPDPHSRRRSDRKRGSGS